MKFSTVKSQLHFSRSQRTGIFVLFFIIIAFQAVYWFFDFNPEPFQKEPDKNKWLSLQFSIDSAGSAQKRQRPKIYPFNPNFITDFKGYRLGMSVEEIDRLLEFRKTDRYVNSAEEFQAVTGVSDSLLATIAPYFKFPDWVKNRQKYKSNPKHNFERPIAKTIIDINLATQEDLKKVYGIGDGLSERILKEKEKLGGFVSMEQMSDIWGLSPEVIEKLHAGFKIEAVPNVKKLNINNASVKELMQFPYFRYPLAKSIVTYRSMNGKIQHVEDLLKISGFPIDKINIIALYLEF